MGIKVRYGGAAGVLEGEYTLTTGVSPSILSFRCAAQDAALPEVADAFLSDGGNDLSLSDCRLSKVLPETGEQGKTWSVQLLDHRWRWRYGWVTGRYNYGVPEGSLPKPGTEEWNARRSARALAALLLDAMGEGAHDVSGLPDSAYPEVNWDYDNPARKLDDLAEKYGCLICFDPASGLVSIWPEGFGQSLPVGMQALSRNETETPQLRPREILAVCDKIELEHPLELEAVGLDVDGEIKPLDDLSYRPAGGWSECQNFLALSNSGSPSPRELALRTCFRWYRGKGSQDVAGWKSAVKLSEILPISAQRVATETVRSADGSVVTRRADAEVFGIRSKMGVLRANEGSGHIEESFRINEADGIVIFQQPQAKWSGNLLIGADLWLRCTVHGPRHTVALTTYGLAGVEIVPCQGLAVQYIDGEPQNLAEVEARLREILEAKAKSYEDVEQATATYIGIHNILLDGRIRQVSWSVGGRGAMTTVGLNSEHRVEIPSAKVRRRAEKQAVTEFKEKLRI
jgi:hypothetical protein